MGTTRSQTTGRGLLDGLGLVGFDSLEPVVVAAVAAELPMLLVGPHGTGKSLLLTRVAEALGLRWRHYNASLLSYDDLVGYPVPDGKGGLDWLKTPATIWEAEAVFLDEINRCRPDLQNKLFPIVHERRIQGIALTSLRHRWAAMNPVDQDAIDDAYAGAEVLDTALADRFAFIVPMPDWRGLKPEDQERLLMADLHPVTPQAMAAFRDAVAAARVRYLEGIAHPDATIAPYVRHALRMLHDAKLPCSPRRGAMLVRTITAIRAARTLSHDDAALMALRLGLPQRASGGKVEEHKIIAAHREAVQLSKAAANDPMAQLLSEGDVLTRTCLALEMVNLDPALRATVVADGFADLPDGARHALAVHAFETGSVNSLLGAVAAQLAEAYTMVVTPQTIHENVQTSGPRHLVWQAITKALARIVEPSAGSAMLENLLVGLWGARRFAQPRDVVTVEQAWRTTTLRLAQRREARADAVDVAELAA